MSVAIVLYLFLPTLLVLALAFLVSKENDSSWKKKKGLNLPPGSMGWPMLGETFPFIKFYSCFSLGEFLEKRMQRYGKIFRSNIFGSPSVVSVDAEFNRFILLNEGRLFEPVLPKHAVQILGKRAPIGISGNEHRLMRSISLDFMNASALRTFILEETNRYTVMALELWKEDTPFSVKDKAYKVTLDIMLKLFLSLTPGEPKSEQLHKLYPLILKGLMGVPLNIPGTACRKAVQARAGILKIINMIKEERICKKKAGTDEIGENDLLGLALGRTNLDDKQFGDLIMGMIFVGHENIATAIAFAIYYLQDCPRAIEQLRKEHLDIARMKKERGEHAALTWEDYKLMNFTQSVINETLRMSNISKFVIKKLITDVQYKGYDIPNGWNIVLVLAAGSFDPSVHENPQKFVPWRWETSPTGVATADNSYMPFGLGQHRCVGTELAKMAVAVFLHHLVLGFDWEMVEPDHPVASGFPIFPKGLPIKVRKLARAC